MIAFIVNLKSGGGRARKAWPEIKRELDRRFANRYRLAYTQRPSHAIELTQEQLRQGVDMVVSVGGDGTLNEVVNGIMTSELPEKPALAMLCYGTGADFIRSIDWPRDYMQALDRIDLGQLRCIDVGKGDFHDAAGARKTRYFINIAEYGAGGEVVARVNALPKFWGGKISFLCGIIVTYLGFRNQSIRFSCDDQSWCEQRLNNTVIANGRYFGSGLLPAPMAELDDGQLDIVTFGDISLGETLLAFPKLRKGQHLSHPKLGHHRAKTITATSEQRVFVDMDGEMVGYLPARFEVIPRALRICV